MATTIYKITPIETHRAAFGVADWDLVPPIIPHRIHIYFGVSDLSEPVDWSLTNVTEINNDITELSPLRESFDEEKNSITFQDIQIKVLNDTGIWDTILDLSKNTEVRIIYEKPIYQQSSQYTPLFWGKVDKNTISYNDDVGVNDSNYKKYREYDFTVIEYTKTLQDVSIQRLRDTLESLGYEYFSNKFYFGSSEIPIFKVEGLHATIVTYYYITVKRLLQTIIKLIYSSNTVIDIKSNIEFYERYSGNKWYLDTDKINDENILIIFKRQIQGWAIDYRETFFDDKDFTDNFSFYKYNNCLELFKELITNFNLTWKVYYTCTAPNIHQFSTNFKFMTRTNGSLNNNIIPNIMKGLSGKITTNEGNGCIVSVLNYGDVTNNKLIVDIFNSTSYIAEAPQTDKMIKYNTPFTSFCPKNNQTTYDALKQCFLGYNNGKLYPINKFVVKYSDTVSETYEVDVQNSELPMYRRVFGKAIANYYGGVYGIYNTKSDIIECELDLLEVNIFDYCQIDSKNYYVFSTEKDLVNGITKINLRSYY